MSNSATIQIAWPAHFSLHSLWNCTANATGTLDQLARLSQMDLKHLFLNYFPCWTSQELAWEPCHVGGHFGSAAGGTKWLPWRHSWIPFTAWIYTLIPPNLLLTQDYAAKTRLWGLGTRYPQEHLLQHGHSCPRSLMNLVYGYRRAGNRTEINQIRILETMTKMHLDWAMFLSQLRQSKSISAYH